MSQMFDGFSITPEANLLRIAYIDINALLIEGFDTTAQDLVDAYRADAENYNETFKKQGSTLYEVAKTLTGIRDLFGADKI
jgi:hypothetical protein